MRVKEGIAIVGMACRYPDAGSPAELWENVLARRRAFRRVPPERLRLADYPDRRPGDPDSLLLAEAAVLDGWEFDRVRFRVAGATFRATDLVHWLALDVAAQALADAGFPDAEGLPRDMERTPPPRRVMVEAVAATRRWPSTPPRCPRTRASARRRSPPCSRRRPR